MGIRFLKSSQQRIGQDKFAVTVCIGKLSRSLNAASLGLRHQRLLLSSLS
jgi:hypothetical protein